MHMHSRNTTFHFKEKSILTLNDNTYHTEMQY
jgi:hypothetical protein